MHLFEVIFISKRLGVWDIKNWQTNLKNTFFLNLHFSTSPGKLNAEALEALITALATSQQNSTSVIVHTETCMTLPCKLVTTTQYKPKIVVSWNQIKIAIHTM